MCDTPKTSAFALAVALVCAGVPVLGGEEKAGWPQFRGPERNGVSQETGLLDKWPTDGPKVLWRVKLGNGYSGISVYKGRIYTMYGRGEDEIAAALDSTTGATIWNFRTDANWRDSQGNGPRSTPTVEGDVVYVLGARGKLYALNSGDGKPIWSRDLPDEYGAKPPRWGVSMSPLVEGELLLVDVGGRDGAGIVAFNKKTGKEIWRSFDDTAGYSAPIAITVGGVRQVLVFTAQHVVALSPGDGSVLWKISWKTSYNVNAASPVFIPPNRFFVSSGYDVGGAVYEIDVDGDRITVDQVWKNREMKNQFSSSILVEDHLYGFDDKTLKCVDAESGERRWRESGFGHGSLTYVDGHLIVLGDQGTLALVEASPDAYREKGRVQIFQGKTWTVPTYVGGKLFLRDEKELISLDAADATTDSTER
jgi:outer membrane protein assembly factor BamB